MQLTSRLGFLITALLAIASSIILVSANKSCSLTAAEKTLTHLSAKFGKKKPNAMLIKSQVYNNVTYLDGHIPITHAPLPTKSEDKKLVQMEYLYRYAQYCAITYCEQQPAYGMSNVHDPQIFIAGFKILEWITLDNILYYIAIHPQQKSIIVAFRGTDNQANWLTDAESWMTKPNTQLFPNAPKKSKIHRGFQDAVNRLVFDATHGIVIKLEPILDQYPGYDVVVTGTLFSCHILVLMIIQDIHWVVHWLFYPTLHYIFNKQK